jgi:hypothetical protein
LKYFFGCCLPTDHGIHMNLVNLPFVCLLNGIPQSFDLDGAGETVIPNLKNILARLGEKLAPAELDALTDDLNLGPEEIKVCSHASVSLLFNHSPSAM